MERIIHVDIERDESEMPARIRIKFSPMPLYLMFRTYDALGPRPMKISELERQVHEDVQRFIHKEIREAFRNLENRLTNQKTGA